MQGYLYSKCISTENITQAIKEINGMNISLIAGPDGLIYNKSTINLENAIKEVRLRLRRYKRINSNVINLFKIEGIIKNQININLYDKYAHQAVYRVINPIIESQMSIHSYGFKAGISTKIPVSKIANVIKGANQIYTIEINVEECFKNVSLKQALICLKQLGINDHRLLITIKHLMYVSRNYKNVSISSDTILGSLLCNCFFNQFDKFMENNFDLIKYSGMKMINYKAHRYQWLEWLNQHEKLIQCKYYRYANNIVILTTIKEEQLYIINQIKNFMNDVMQLDVNALFIKMNQNKVNFLGFRLIKDKRSIWIKVKNEQIIYNEIRKFTINSHYNIMKFKKFVLRFLYYYDIVNDMSKLLNKISQYLFFQCRKRFIKQIKGTTNIYYKTSKNVKIDIWEIRRLTKESFKTYIFNSKWLKEREYLNNSIHCNNEWYLYKWILFTKQKGKDKITGNYLKAKDCVIHHIIPRNLGGNDDINNLILISSETHKKLHYSKELLPNTYIKYRKHLQLI